MGSYGANDELTALLPRTPHPHPSRLGEWNSGRPYWGVGGVWKHKSSCLLGEGLSHTGLGADLEQDWGVGMVPWGRGQGVQPMSRSRGRGKSKVNGRVQGHLAGRSSCLVPAPEGVMRATSKPEFGSRNLTVCFVLPGLLSV